MRISDWSSDVCSSDLLYFGYVGLHPLHSLRTAPKPLLSGNQSHRRQIENRNLGKAAIKKVINQCRGATSHINNRGVGEYRSEEHTSELQSLMRISYAVFCLKKKHSRTQIIYNKQ